jgi:FtsH-binding integral membrane protein
MGAPLPRPRAKRFAAFHKADRNFFLIFLLVCWLGVAMGFAPAVTKRMAGEAQYAAPLVLQIHAIAFIGWLALLSVQILLVRTLRTRQHQLLGLAGFALLPVMLVSGYVSEVYAQRFRFDHGHPDFAFFIVPIYDLVAFGTLAAIALLLRRDPPAHKRMILLATTVIVGAAYGRWWGEALLNAFGDDFRGMLVNTFTGTNLILAGAIAYDLATRHKVHRVYQIGVPAILAAEMVTSLIYHSPRWTPIAGALVGR